MAHFPPADGGGNGRVPQSSAINISLQTGAAHHQQIAGSHSPTLSISQCSGCMNQELIRSERIFAICKHNQKRLDATSQLLEDLQAQLKSLQTSVATLTQTLLAQNQPNQQNQTNQSTQLPTGPPTQPPPQIQPTQPLPTQTIPPLTMQAVPNGTTVSPPSEAIGFGDEKHGQNGSGGARVAQTETVTLSAKGQEEAEEFCEDEVESSLLMASPGSPFIVIDPSAVYFHDPPKPDKNQRK